MHTVVFILLKIVGVLLALISRNSDHLQEELLQLCPVPVLLKLIFQRFSMQPIQLRFVVERVDLAESAAQADVDHPGCGGLEMRRSGIRGRDAIAHQQ